MAETEREGACLYLYTYSRRLAGSHDALSTASAHDREANAASGGQHGDYHHSKFLPEIMYHRLKKIPHMTKTGWRNRTTPCPLRPHTTTRRTQPQGVNMMRTITATPLTIWYGLCYVAWHSNAHFSSVNSDSLAGGRPSMIPRGGGGSQCSRSYLFTPLPCNGLMLMAARAQACSCMCVSISTQIGELENVIPLRRPALALTCSATSSSRSQEEDEYLPLLDSYNQMRRRMQDVCASTFLRISNTRLGGLTITSVGVDFPPTSCTARSGCMLSWSFKAPSSSLGTHFTPSACRRL